MTLQGLLLFLFIPLVLVLLLRQPLGPGWSVALGVAVMLGHRLVALNWMAKYADVRCLWCGRVGCDLHFEVEAGRRRWTMSACEPGHADRAQRFLRFVDRHRAPLTLGVFAPLAWLIGTSIAAAAGWSGPPHALNALIFRVVVGVTVVSAATIPFVSDPVAEADAPIRCPFALHHLFLLGIRNTLWIFRAVGAWWIATGMG